MVSAENSGSLETIQNSATPIKLQILFVYNIFLTSHSPINVILYSYKWFKLFTMISCGLISKYLEIKSFLLIYLPQFRRDFFLDSLFFLTPCTPKSLMTKSYFIQISVKPLHWNCSLVFLLVTFSLLYFVGDAGAPTLFSFFLLETQFSLHCRPPPHILSFHFWFYFGMPSLLLSFTSCAKRCRQSHHFCPLSTPTYKSWELRTSPHPHHKMIPVSSLSMSSRSSPPPPPCSTEPFARPFHSLPAFEPLTIIWGKYVSNRKWNEMPQRQNHLNTILKEKNNPHLGKICERVTATVPALCCPEPK